MSISISRCKDKKIFWIGQKEFCVAPAGLGGMCRIAWSVGVSPRYRGPTPPEKALRGDTKIGTTKHPHPDSH